jgi:AcrR family transcriptional regulator
VSVEKKASRRNLGASPEDARTLLKQAAEQCVERHGVNKTTMEDIAKQAGVSRPTVYRYFSDRDELLLAVLADRANALTVRAHRYIATQSSLADKLVEGLIYLAEHGSRDPFVRADDDRYVRRMMESGVGGQTAANFWAPVLGEAAAKGELVDGLNLAMAFDWLADVGLVIMEGLESSDQTVNGVRAMLRSFVVPAFTKAVTSPQ